MSPRDAVSFLLSEKGTARQALPLALELAQKIIAPEKGEALRFRPLLLDANAQTLYLTARVYSSSGRLVDVIFEQSPRSLTREPSTVWDEWDGRNFRGSLVPGGIYVLTLSGGAARDAATGIASRLVRGTATEVTACGSPRTCP